MKVVLSEKMFIKLGMAMRKAKKIAAFSVSYFLIMVTQLFAGEITLQDNSLLVSFESRSGALTCLKDKITNWTIERRPELADSFRLFAPLPERRWNPVFGKKQRAEVKKISAHEIRLQWKNLLSENGGVLPITLTADVTLTNGVLTFNATLENDSSLTVETLDYPYFGDLNPPSRGITNMTVRLMKDSKSDDLISDEIYPHFSNKKGYWGVFWPTKIMDSQQSPFCLIQAPDDGFYVQAGNGESPYHLQYTFEQHPGVMSTITALVPPGDEFAGTPVHLEFRMCHLVFQKPHSTIKLAPIVLRCYNGDWHEGVNLYKRGTQLSH
jgi:hypothetical protein